MAHIYFGQWEWFTDPLGIGSWRAPGGDAVGSLDLRSLTACGLAGGLPQGFGFFVYPTTRINPLLIRYIGDDVNGNLTVPQKSALQAVLGVVLSSTRVIDVLWELFNVWADSTGLARWKPLMPQVDGRLVLHLGGFSPVRDDAYSHAAYPLCLQVTKQDWEMLERNCFETQELLFAESLSWERVRERFRGLQALKGTDPDVVSSPEWARLERFAALPEPDHHRRVLQGLCEKYHMTVAEFETIWARALPTALPHSTTVTENWNCADSTSLNCQQTWTQVAGTWNILTNTNSYRTVNAADRQEARCEATLASSDHYGQAALTTFTAPAGSLAGSAARFAAAARTAYLADLRKDGTFRTLKHVTGSDTVIGVGTTETIAIPNTLKVQANGSSITRYFDGVLKDTVTDTGITGNVRGGVEGNIAAGGAAGDVAFDNFEAADLAAARKLEQVERHYPRGVLRGVGRGVE